MILSARKREPVSPQMQLFMDYLYVIVGAIFVGTAFSLFLLPNQIASGGIAGISTILNGLFGLKPSLVQWFFNIPLFIIGVIILGKQYGLKTLVGTIFLPFVVFLTENMEPATHDPLLGALFGGIGVGIGLGILFRGRASTGGVDLIAQIVNKYTGISLGKCILLIDGSIVTISAFVFSLEQGLYALIAMFLTSKTIDIVQMGLGYSKMAIIITNEEEKMRQGILKEVYRGVTKISAFGGYTQQERPMLMCVVGQTEVMKLKRLVRTIDPTAFVIVMNANEVFGEGFTEPSHT
jgi:uncharacterized membrane-anchored protein YitT (DUF2179 family)